MLKEARCYWRNTNCFRADGTADGKTAEQPAIVEVYQIVSYASESTYVKSCSYLKEAERHGLHSLKKPQNLKLGLRHRQCRQVG